MNPQEPQPEPQSHPQPAPIAPEPNLAAEPTTPTFPPEQPPEKPAKKPRKLLRIIIPILIVAAALYSYFFVDYAAISDWNRARDFEPTAEMSAIIDDLSLTDLGLRIFRASHPTLKEGVDFSEYCGNDRSEISILGCYASSNIYIKHVTDPDLAGILESTSAHELLHAAWSRLDETTQSELAEHLIIVYEQHESTLSSRLESYEESRHFDELHSIVGTEYVDMPDALSAHYAEYFTDQPAIVAHFTRYNSKFQALRAESDRLHQEIEALKAKIAANTQNYEDGVDEINAAIDDFRRRVENGSFDNNPTAFYREQGELNARIDQLNALYNIINADIESVNKLIDEYNANAASLNDLNAAISSPPAPPSV